MQSFLVNIEIFEGPMDILLYLVEKQNLDIYDIPISQITKDFLSYVEKLRDFEIDIASSFLIMATRLIRIKSKLLLPKTEEEKMEAEMEKKELEEELLEYKKAKEIAKALKEKLEKRKGVYFRNTKIIPEDQYTIELTLFDLANVFKQLIKQAKIEPREILAEEITIEEKIDLILDSLRKNEKLSLKEIVGKTILELVVTFLAILELVRIGKIRCFQNRSFSDIKILRGENFGKQ